MEGDALSILDCCCSSLAGLKGKAGLPRTYQLLAASSADGPTSGPGPKSFTTALCDSLEELLAEARGGTFFLSQLAERINIKRLSQPCLTWDRLRIFKRTIELGRLGQASMFEDPLYEGSKEQSSRYLEFFFKVKVLTADQIQGFAKCLPQACHEASIPIRRIDWMRMAPKQHDPNEIFNEDPEQSSLVLRFSLRTRTLEKSQLQKLTEQLPRACQEAGVPVRRIEWVRAKKVNGQSTEGHSYSDSSGTENRSLVLDQDSYPTSGSWDIYFAARTVMLAQKWRRIASEHKQESKPQTFTDRVGSVLSWLR
jgi:hypothetical protein